MAEAAEDSAADATEAQDTKDNLVNQKGVEDRFVFYPLLFFPIYE